MSEDVHERFGQDWGTLLQQRPKPALVSKPVRRSPRPLPEAVARGRAALGKLATVTAEAVPNIRTKDAFGAPHTELALPLNRKTTANERRHVRLDALEPRQELIPVAGMERYLAVPRRDPPDVAHVVMRNGRERWLVQEGHTRLAAAKLRGDESMDVRVWEFTEDESGSLVPVARGLQRRGLAYRDKLRSLSADQLSALDPEWQLDEDGLTRAFTLPNRRACASFIEALAHEANRANHHPDLSVADCIVTVTYVTHSEGNTVTDKDYDGAALADRLYATTPDMQINLPDIADVSFPSMIGAIHPDKPAKKKRKRVQYKGISLSRVPTRFEAEILNLTEIPRRLDAARDAVVANDTVMALHVADIARYGAEQVLEELVKQGAPVRLAQVVPPLDADALYRGLVADRDRAIADMRASFEHRLSARRLPVERRDHVVTFLMERALPALKKRYANRAINCAFAYGRAGAVLFLRRKHVPLATFELAKKKDEFEDEFEEDEPHVSPNKKWKDESGKFISKIEAVNSGDLAVDAVVQSAVMDTNTCDECLLVDGEVMELGDKRQLELDPPYVKCYGGDNCRCVQIALLEDGTEIDVDEIDEDTID